MESEWAGKVGFGAYVFDAIPPRLMDVYFFIDEVDLFAGPVGIFDDSLNRMKRDAITVGVLDEEQDGNGLAGFDTVRSVADDFGPRPVHEAESFEGVVDLRIQDGEEREKTVGQIQTPVSPLEIMKRSVITHRKDN